ncbi:hypothetical protein CVT25_013326 [Psilocybe cyanescens]|uniref:Mid2 domain-containing protein n=1 Tax=Psilocybe cyanescens TaxID=93625 RepID=A0A409WSQ5_PSICY|nr:hypothetical protein CVT25_013326 [Psilocybe cyanescens]
MLFTLVGIPTLVAWNIQPSDADVQVSPDLDLIFDLRFVLGVADVGLATVNVQPVEGEDVVRHSTQPSSSSSTSSTSPADQTQTSSPSIPLPNHPTSQTFIIIKHIPAIVSGTTGGLLLLAVMFVFVGRRRRKKLEREDVPSGYDGTAMPAYSVATSTCQTNTNTFFRPVEKTIWNYANGGTWTPDSAKRPR